jgi:transposase
MSTTTEASRSLYCGLDLHSSNTVAAIVDQDGRRICRGKLANRIQDLDDFLRPHKDQLVAVVVESTFNWYWLVDGLEALDYPMVLAHPAAMVQYAGLKHADDKTDAFWLAEQCRLGLIPKAYIYPKEDRPLRDLLRRRMLLVQNRTSFVLSLGSMHVRETGVTLPRGAVHTMEPEDLLAAFPAPFAKIAATALDNLIDTATLEIKNIDAQALRAHRPTALFQRITRLDGIANILGMIISLETGSMDRFATAGDYASYCRTVPTRRESNGRKKGEGNAKNGNRYLAWAWVEAAQYARRFQPLARAWYDRKARATNKVVATKALACKLCKAGYYVMRDDAPFDAARLFH